MSILENQIAKTLCPGMSIPAPLALLFSWIESNELFVDGADGQRSGQLYPQRLAAGWTDTERSGGTMVTFVAEGNVDMGRWLGNDDPATLSRLCVFAQTGGEGSRAAFWLDDDGRQRIVHLGSGSGSLLTCVLADDPVDFLRLLAIGYDEICWGELFGAPPNANPQDGDVRIHPNLDYQAWVRETFSVEIPQTAREILAHPASMDDNDSPDPFCRWVERSRR